MRSVLSEYWVVRAFADDDSESIGRNVMPRHLKRGMDASAIKAADAKVRETVEQILADIDARKDVAVRELSQKFDNWAPASFKLAPAEARPAIGAMKRGDLDDINLARHKCATSRKSRRRRCAISKSRRCP